MKLRCLTFLVAMATLFETGCAVSRYLNFLSKYGYLPEIKGNDRSKVPTPEEQDAALREFQRFAGLSETGVFDEWTKEKMQQSRCGVKDINKENEKMSPAGPANLKRFKDRWDKKDLTWSLKKFSKTSKMSRKQQLNAIRQGFRRWAEVTNLKFREVTGKADIVLSFEKLEHGDNDSFDGRGATLGHAFPPDNGRTHFDDDEDWTEGVDRGTNLEFVATHEIGHALGLYHTPGTYHVMSPYYPGYEKDFKLHRYDIMDIQRRYGKRPINGTVDLPKFCGHEYKTIKAAMRVKKNVDYIFIDHNMVINGMNGQKTRLGALFSRGPIDVDAAVFSELTNAVYLFYGQKVWKFSELEEGSWFELMPGFPKDLGNSQLTNPEAAVKVKNEDGTEAIYLIKEGRIWEWIPYHERLAPGIGLPAKDFFHRIPEKIDAAITSENAVNFIVGNKFYTNKASGRLTSKRSIHMNFLLKCNKQ